MLTFLPAASLISFSPFHFALPGNLRASTVNMERQEDLTPWHQYISSLRQQIDSRETCQAANPSHDINLQLETPISTPSPNHRSTLQRDSIASIDLLYPKPGLHFNKHGQGDEQSPQPPPVPPKDSDYKSWPSARATELGKPSCSAWSLSSSEISKLGPSAPTPPSGSG